MTDELPLAAEFPPASREDWLKLVRTALKDRPFERLIAKTYDGIPIEPLYPRAAGAKPIAARRGASAGQVWALQARVDHPDPAIANAEALHELENGATALTDRRGECVYAGCPHYRKCFIERAARASAEADIVIAAAGQPHMLTADMIKEGAALLDVGVSRVDGKLTGDIHPDCWDKAGFVSPNPGGVGPLTRAFLVRNIVERAEKLA